jgi:hypothetical protein
MGNMKAKYIIILIYSGFLILAGFTTYGQDPNNPHEFTPGNWEFSERCNPCHVYNAENSNADNGYLIDYESDSLSSADSTYLSGISKICFTCHDGTVATFGHNGNTDQTTVGDGTSNNHPVSVIYQVGDSTKSRLYNPDITMSGLGNTITIDMLKNGRIECTSCHDVHFSKEITACKSCPPTKSTAYASNKNVSLLKTNSKSALCLTCHKL